jgi:hypothetical protein
MVGGPVALCFVLARSETAGVRIQRVVAFPTGFEFEVVARFAPRGDVWDPMHGLAGLCGKPGAPSGEPSDEHLRLHIRFPDGSEANNLGPPMLEPSRSGPFLRPRAGRCDASMVEATLWVSPLPPAGQVTFICEWPMYGISPTPHAVDTHSIREAGARATHLWPVAGQDEV